MGVGDMSTKQRVLKLTKEFVAKVQSTGAREVFRDTECRGLVLFVNANGSKSWYFDYRDPQGKRQSFKVADADRVDPGEARKRVAKLGDDPAGEKRAAKADAAKAESRTVRKFLEGRYWSDYLSSSKSGLATQKRILSAWSPFIDTDMAVLDVQDVIQHRQDRVDDEITPQTLNRDRTAILAMINKAVEWKLIDRNPLDDKAFKPLGTEDDKRVRWLGQNDEHEDIKDNAGKKIGERERFMLAVQSKATPEYLRRMAIIAMNTGLRRGELFKLRWQNVSIQRAELTVAASTAKTGKTRHIPLNATALAVFEEIKKVRHVSGFVFINPETDKPFTTLKRSWKTLAELARLDDFTFHDLRHDFASRLVQSGVNLYEVRDLLGHSSITLTERYAHLAPHQKRAAVAVLDEVAA